jgi:hypothetical protein
MEEEMAVKDITDRQVCEAYSRYQARVREETKTPRLYGIGPGHKSKWAYDYLMEITGQPFKVCYRAMERADDRKYIDYGVSLRSGWLTEKGENLLKEPPPRSGEEEG